MGVYAIPSDDAFVLAVLSSTVHQVWLDAVSPRLEDRPRWKPAIVFDPFPFPALEEGELKQRIRDLGERLDAHRKRQQELHPGLTLTGIYNVLEKLRADEPLTAKDKQIHDQGLVTLLRQIHDELDEAVLEAYGWSDLAANATHCSVGLRPSLANESAHPLTSNFSFYQDELLTRLVALNHERAAEEKHGLIRYLRPEYQNPTATTPQATQSPLPGTESPSSLNTENLNLKTPAWPDRLPAQVTLIRQLLAQSPTATPEQLSTHFGRKNQKRTEQIEGIIETLRGLGQV